MYCSYRRRRRRIKWNKIFRFFVIIGVLIGLIVYYKLRIAVTIQTYAVDEINAKVTAAVNRSVLLNLSDEKYDDLVVVEKNAAGEITMMAANSLLINRINKEIAVSSQALITTACDEGVGVPVGAFSGISLIVGFGPVIDLDILTAESVNCSFYSEFESMGINQTRHAVYIDVESTVNVIIPGDIQTVQVHTPVLICEAVIVGKIPEVYLNGSLF